jgi:hypothetical protein
VESSTKIARELEQAFATYITLYNEMKKKKKKKKKKKEKKAREREREKRKQLPIKLFFRKRR